MQLTTSGKAEGKTHHGKKARPGVPCSEVLVCKPAAVNAHAACPVSLQKVSPLDAELLDDAVEGRSFVAKRVPTLPASKQSVEVRGIDVSSGQKSSLF